MALRNAFGDISLESTQLEVLGQFNSEFSRILEKRFLDTEEVRYDIPPNNTALANGSIYIGIAADASATNSPVWTVVRFYFNAAARPIRARIRKDIQWDERTLGWT